jgi:tetratricopeptide (TPR) repeat protein
MGKKLQQGLAVEAFNRGLSLIEKGKLERGVFYCDLAVRRARDHARDPAMCDLTACALHCKASALTELGRFDEAIEACNQVLDRFGHAREPELREHVARALVSKGTLLLSAARRTPGRYEETLGVFDEVVDRYRDAAEPSLREHVAKAIVSRLTVVVELETPEATMRQLAPSHARIDQACRKVDLGQPAEALSYFDDAISRRGGAIDPVSRTIVAEALYNKAATLNRLGRFDDAVTCFDEVVERFGDATDPSQRAMVARALEGKGTALGRLGRSRERIATLDEVLARFSGLAGLQESVAGTLA